MRSSSLPAALLLCTLAAGPAFAASVEVRMVLQVHSTDPAQVTKTAEVIRHRLDELGLDDPEVSVQGDRISVRVGEVEDHEQMRRVVLSNATIGLHLVRFPAGGATAASRDEILQSYQGQLPAGLEILAGDRPGDGGKKTTVYYAVERQPIVTGADFASVRPGMGQFGQPMLSFRLGPEAAARFAKATGDNVGSSLAIVLNGRVLSAPVIKSRISESGQIEGAFTEQDVQDLAIVLRSGALPAEITLLEDQTLASSHHGLSKRARTLLIGAGAVVVALLAAFSLRSRGAP